jgi:PKHD-type hydroxylase
MIVTIPNLLTPEEVQRGKALLDAAEWVDGKVTAGHQSAKSKNNSQIPEGHPAAVEVGEMILKALEKNALFISSALPSKVFPPLFNRYSGGQEFGMHVDNAIRQVPGTPFRIRTDLSATLFFNEPDTYEGGELCIEDVFGVKNIKLPAGHMVLYPSTSLHYVTPVTQGERLCSFFWMQSMIRKDSQRTLLFDLDMIIQNIAQTQPNSPHPIQLTGVYHNLLREWAEL